jgi:hypothetical protein
MTLPIGKLQMKVREESVQLGKALNIEMGEKINV